MFISSAFQIAVFVLFIIAGSGMLIFLASLPPTKIAVLDVLYHARTHLSCKEITSRLGPRASEQVVQDYLNELVQDGNAKHPLGACGLYQITEKARARMNKELDSSNLITFDNMP